MSAVRYLINTITSEYVSSMAPDLKGNQLNNVIVKAKEYLRGLEAAISCSAGRLPQNFSLCEIAVCVDIACKFLNISNFSRELAIKKTAANALDYDKAFNEAVNLLNVTFPIKFDDLCLTFGCSGISTACDKLLELYKQEMVKKYPKVGANFSKPVFKAVAFFLAATHQFKFKVDKKKLIEETRCSSSTFDDVMESMKNVCKLGQVEIKVKSGEQGEASTPNKRKHDELEQDSTPNKDSLMSPPQHADVIIGLDETKVIVNKKKQTNTNKTNAKKKNQKSQKPSNPPTTKEESSKQTLDNTSTSTSTSTTEETERPKKKVQLTLDFFK